MKFYIEIDFGSVDVSELGARREDIMGTIAVALDHVTDFELGPEFPRRLPRVRIETGPPMPAVTTAGFHF